MINMKKHELGDIVDFDEGTLLQDEEIRYNSKTQNPSALESINQSEN